jgi:uncharacterized protein
MSFLEKKHAVLAEIARSMKEKKFLLGRTKAQKLVFLLAELYKVPTDYLFRFYTYGPFSNELAGDIDYLAKIDVLDSTFYLDKGFYEIEPGKLCDQSNIQKTLSKDDVDLIQKLVEEFGTKNAQELELVSTIVFVNRFDEFGATHAGLMERTKVLKPKFSEDDIQKAIDSVRNRLPIHIDAVTA